MKKISIIATGALFMLLSGSYGQDLNTILDEHFKASGTEKMAKIESQVITGKNIVTSMGMEMPFVITTARPNKIRVESSFQGSKIIQTFDGTTGWMLSPILGSNEPKELSETEMKSLKNQGDMDGILWNYEAKGHVVELAGEETVNGSPAYHVKITTSEGDVVNHYIDKTSYLLVKVSTRQMMGGAEAEVENIMKDYRMVKGINVAHSIDTRMNDQTLTTIKIEKVDFNKEVDDSLFGKPTL
ncbi:MAG: outer membrane lipoprotein-sorting protein [Bacteroidales bacterium]|nr:outer membrane lipoprotein-sorting protein [Bacteroidales bacterium]